MRRSVRLLTASALALALLNPGAVFWLAPPSGPSVAGSAPPDQVPIVYSRCARTERQAPITGEVFVGGHQIKVTKTLGHTDVLDVLPDVTNFFGGFSVPCDLVFREPDGRERVLYDCASRSSDAATCAALDAAVSFDGKTIAFAVFRGSIERRAVEIPARFFHPAAPETAAVGVQLPNAYLKPTEAQVHLADLASGTVIALPHTAGVFDSGPAWLSNGRLAFTSTRSNQFSTPILGATSQRRATQIFTMDIDGRNVEKASYHALAGEQHPFQLRDGRIAMSSWQLFGMLPYRHDNGSPGGFGTLDNFFHVYSQHPDGANLFPLFGQHTLNHGTYPGAPPAHFAAHFLTQGSDGRLWVADYYRGNNSGLGQVVGFPLPAAGHEGIGPDARPHIHDIYRPRGFTVFAPWTSGFDLFAPPMPGKLKVSTYRDPLVYAGKLSHPAALPRNALLLTWGLGACSTEASGDLVGNQAFARTAAADPAYRAVRLGEGTVPLLSGGTPPAVEVTHRPGYGLQFEYLRDIFPILQRRCASCHSGAGAAAGLPLDLPGTGPGSTHDRLVLDGGQRFVPAERRYPHPIHKPQITRYVRALNARGSPLYWKAANHRTDARTDRTYTALSGPGWEDVDFGPAHPTSITPEELGILSRWLDTGAAAASGFLLDTTPPALQLAGAADGSSLTTLHFGTVDVASGVRPESLEVCIAPRDSACGPNIAPHAEPHAVVVIRLSPTLGDPDLEIRARIRDHAGNETEERRTVRWLLDAARTAAGWPPAAPGPKVGSR